MMKISIPLASLAFLAATVLSTDAGAQSDRREAQALGTTAVPTDVSAQRNRQGAQRRGGAARAAPRAAPRRAAQPRLSIQRRAAPSRSASPRRAVQHRRAAPHRRSASPRRATPHRRAVQQRPPHSRAQQRAEQRRQDVRQDRRQQRAQQSRQEQRQDARQERRDDRRDARQDRRQEQRQDARQERREEQRQDARQERREERAQDRREQRREQAQERREDRRDARRDRRQRLTAQQARQGRFAARWHDRRAERRAERHDRRWWRRATWRAWRRGVYAHYVPWYGAVYWPYAYADLFYFTFWPYAYDYGYWAYAYDDFFDGIFFPYGAPYTEYAYAGPYASVAETTGAAGSGTSAYATVPGEVSKAALQLCRQPENGMTAWPFDRIEKAVDPTDEQQALLADLRRAADEAAQRFAQACPEHVPMTPVGRIEVMTERLRATLEAVRIVRPPLERFYQSLSDEQQARFNEIGPDIGKKRRGSLDQAKAQCGEEKSGLTSLPIARIEDVVRPTDDQGELLDKLSDALDQAASTLEQACPNYIPQTPVGRLEVMQQRLEAMLEAANTVHPPLEDFYASLDSEQKARFNRLGRELARTDR
jgi:hypothetical protein